jgi:bifunctional ADP-heptose synthase (sugar kinase/adenylyltransferase)
MNIAAALAAAATKRVLFIGEEITDVYHFGNAMQRPAKEQILCMEAKETEAYQGGVIAAAKHAETFCDTVHIVSTHRIRKERYVEQTHTRKLFEVYVNGGTLEHPVIPPLEYYDVVVVTDYGHGMMNEALIEKVCAEARFLAVNVQANAGNYGFNLATKYPRADYLCMSELEARLATQNRDGAIEASLEELACIAPRVAITLGRKGAIGTGGVRVPAFVEPVIDTMGAGDAFFAVTACVAEDVGMADLLRIGNAAGKLKAQIVGHRKAVSKNELLAYLRSQGC